MKLFYDDVAWKLSPLNMGDAPRILTVDLKNF